jgi:hypothetical protein
MLASTPALILFNISSSISGRYLFEYTFRIPTAWLHIKVAVFPNSIKLLVGYLGRSAVTRVVSVMLVTSCGLLVKAVCVP